MALAESMLDLGDRAELLVGHLADGLHNFVWGPILACMFGELLRADGEARAFDPVGEIGG
jgi:hypothetical protein